MSQPSAVIFDMDGVLLNTYHHIKAYLYPLFREYGVDVATFNLHTAEHHGRSLADIIAWTNRTFGLEINHAEFVARANEASRKQVEAEQPRPKAELLKFLDELRLADIRIGLGTSSERVRAEHILGTLGIRERFSVVVGAEDVHVHKPEPALFLAVAQQLAVPPARCVVIEDAQNGIEAAHRAGMKAIGYREFSEGAFAITKADLVANSFVELSVERVQELLAS